MVTIEQIEFLATKNPEQEFETLTFLHPKFKEPVRLVANQFKSEIFQSQSYLPVAMKVKPPDVGKDLASQVSIQFARVQIGDAFSEVLKTFKVGDWMKPITVIYQRFTDSNRENPIGKFSLYVSDISMNAQSIQIKARDDIEMVLDVSTTYTLEEYPSLEQL